MTPTPLITFLIAAYNRRDVLLHTLGRLQLCGLRAGEFEVILVDNASTDGTAAAVSSAFPSVRLVRATQNRGACAKNVGLPLARGRFVIFLDDDSFPAPGAVARMVRHFEADPSLGAAVFTITLPDGSRECSAYPNVFIGCGTGFRRRALEQVGGLPEDFFMQAEEYDLSLRLLAAGWDVRAFDDLHVTHLKTPNARVSTRTTRLDVRNNLTLIFRHFPERWVTPFALDWLRRYELIARAKGHLLPHWQGTVEACARAVRGVRRQPLSEAAFERFARVDETRRRLARVKEHLGLRRMLFVDLGKNVLPYWLAARACGLEVVAVADARLGGHGWRYRGAPIVTDAAARELSFDAAVVSNLSSVHAAARRDAWRRLAPHRPVLDLFGRIADEAGSERPTFNVERSTLNVGRSAFPSFGAGPSSPSPTASAAPAGPGSRRTAARIAG